MGEDSNFYEKVYELVRLIPYGRVTSYGAIARNLGRAGSARMVGYALRATNDTFPPIPAHRVVNRVGLLSGRASFPTPTLMQELLENEGLAVVDNRIVNFKEKFWDPESLDTEAL